jgi:glycosyltransferase involved in cell wall biosynthesis
MDNPRPHVILIAYYFPPSEEIGAQRPFRFDKYLRRLGYNCEVITATAQREPRPGVTVVRDELEGVWERPGARRSFNGYIELLLRKIMLPGHVGFLWSRAVASECSRIVRDNPGDRFVVLSTYPPIGTLLAGLNIRLRQRVRWIADFRDPIGGVPLRFLQRRVRFWIRMLEGLTFRVADAVVANADAAAAVWREQHPRAARKLHVIYNGFDPDDMPQAREIPSRPRRLIVHAGTLYHGRNPNAVIEAFARLRVRGAAETASAGFLFLGDIDIVTGLNRAVVEEGQRQGWVALQGIVPRSQALRALEEADGLLLVQPQTKIQIPGKLFEYICIGRPVLAIVPRSSPIETILVNSSAAHVCIYPDDPHDIADQKLLDFLRFPNTPRTINAWFQANCNSQYQTEALAHIVDAVAARGNVSRFG